MPKDLGTWGFLLSLLALILMYPVGVLINLTSPAIANRFARWSKASLVKRIGKLERELADLEKYPVIDPVQNEMLWAIKSVKIAVFSVGGGIILMLYWGLQAITDPNAPAFRGFSGVVFFAVFTNMSLALGSRYHRDFRWKRSPVYRENLKKSIQELKELRDKWPV